MRLRRARPIRRAAAIASVTVLVALLTGGLPSSVAVAQPTATSVTVTVLQVTPSTPVATTTPRTIDVELKLTNTTQENLGTVTVQGARGNPISNQTALDHALADPEPPDESLQGKFTASTPVTALLPARSSTTVSYLSTTANSTATAGLCICENRIYPLYFTVLQQLAGGKSVLVGSTQTFIPAFGTSNPKRVRVSWVWPILERPHRSVHDDVFTDDALAASADAGGRLDRLLQVVEQVAAQQVPMTVLVDPDLVDELAVMAAGPYKVVSSPGHTVAGTGTDAAKTWLARLRTALDSDPELEISFTPYADPDVDSLARNGLGWSTKQSAAAQARVSDALGGRSVPTDIAWPLNGSLSPDTLDTLVRKGTRAVIVNDTTLPGGKHESPLPDALASIATQAGRAPVAVTSAAIQRFAADVVTQGRGGLATLPQLVSEVAIRAVEDGANSHYLLITPPRNVNPDPSAAVAAILQTAHTIWSRPLALRQAAQTVPPADHGRLVERPATGLPEATIDTVQFVTDSVPALVSLIHDGTERSNLLGSLPEGIQRSESSEWVADPGTGAARAQALRKRVTSVTSGVRLIKPTTGTYTLGSADSPLPITIDNTLDAQVNVRVEVSTVGGLPGFRASDIGVQTVPSQSKLSLHIPVHVDRAGRIKVQVELMTPDGAALGTTLPLSIRSTALGDIGKIITFVAGAVLALALLFRVLMRWRRHQNGSARGAA